MALHNSLKMGFGGSANRSVLTRAERISKLQADSKWEDGQSPVGLPKVRVFKLVLKKKKKKEEDTKEDE